MAKSFYTDGVGNQQTLTNSQNEKIPIYDTLADAQSDLANLEEGQIINIKNLMIGKIKTISNIKQIVSILNEVTIVDSVTTGNMNAVTSNAVYTAIDNEATARGTAITNAINSLDVASQGGSNKYIKAIQQTNGLISATEGTVDTTVTQNSNNPVTSGAVYTAIQSSGGGLDWATVKQNIATDLGLTASQYNGNSATATLAYKIRTSTPSSPVDGDVWIE